MVKLLLVHFKQLSYYSNSSEGLDDIFLPIFKEH